MRPAEGNIQVLPVRNLETELEMPVDARTWLREHDESATLLGICPMSEEIITASLREAAAEPGFVPMFIATPRQVDADRGYTGWSQAELTMFLDETAASVGYDGNYVVARDHGGPYQSTRDRGDASVPLDDAMAYAKELFAADVRNGFDVLHVDATEDARNEDILALDEIARRTTELIDYTERVIEDEGLSEVYYEVGTEEINGGMTDPDDFERFITKLHEELREVGRADVLSRLLFVVGQVGTTMRIDQSNEFNPEKARELTSIVSRHDHYLKVHYTDWLDTAELEQFPRLGVGAANVGPEFAAAIVEGLEALERKERTAIEGTDASSSDFMETLEAAAVADAPWKKFAPDDLDESNLDDFTAEHSRDIAVCVGRYVLNDEAVVDARETLYDNITTYTGVSDPHREVTGTVRDVIHRYVEAFGLSEPES